MQPNEIEDNSDTDKTADTTKWEADVSTSTVNSNAD